MKPTLAIAYAQADATEALEREAGGEAGDFLQARLDVARRELVASYTAAFGGPEEDASPGPELAQLLAIVAATLTSAMAGAGETSEAIIRRWTEAAGNLGVAHAREVAEEAPPFVSPALDLGAATSAPGIVSDAERDALALLGAPLALGAGLVGLVGVVGRANQAVHRLRAAARWSVNRGHADGVRAITDPLGYGRVWVAERDGCVHCLAYSGKIAMAGGEFPVGLTFGKSPLTWAEELPDPPLHPNCRCQTIPWLPGHGMAFPEALEREARRSIARGWSLENEAEGVRLDAAERLLARGANLPKTVQERARRAVRLGTFPSGRVPPTRR